MTDDRTAHMDGGLHSPLSDIEDRLAGIIAAVRDVAVAAEELLREISVPDGALRHDLPARVNVNCAPFMMEASRVQISALSAMIGRDQPLAA
ncbi:MAG: hypothetical protein ACRCTI_09610 [Beijerinckiaceae bacterium]